MVSVDVLAIGAGILIACLAIIFVVYRRRRKRPIDGARGTSSHSLRSSLAPARQSLVERIHSLWAAPRSIDARVSGLEEVLLGADVGVEVAQRLIERVREHAYELTGEEDLRRLLGSEMLALLTEAPVRAGLPHPLVILVVGVNGVGKTTSIGKLAHHYMREGRSVLLVAGDTFRAAAAEQLEIWADKIGANLVRHRGTTDPSAVVYDGMKAALARDTDVVIIDTAGRLHVKSNLVEELKKIARVIERLLPGAPHEVLLVIDATTGQNALTQARVFHEALPLTGVILTKLDGTARGGVVLGISSRLGVPIRYIGYGEAVDAFAPFDAAAFVDALLQPENPAQNASS